MSEEECHPESIKAQESCWSVYKAFHRLFDYTNVWRITGLCTGDEGVGTASMPLSINPEAIAKLKKLAREGDGHAIEVLEAIANNMELNSVALLHQYEWRLGNWSNWKVEHGSGWTSESEDGPGTRTRDVNCWADDGPRENAWIQHPNPECRSVLGHEPPAKEECKQKPCGVTTTTTTTSTISAMQQLHGNEDYNEDVYAGKAPIPEELAWGHVDEMSSKPFVLQPLKPPNPKPKIVPSTKEYLDGHVTRCPGDTMDQPPPSELEERNYTRYPWLIRGGLEGQVFIRQLCMNSRIGILSLPMLSSALLVTAIYDQGLIPTHNAEVRALNRPEDQIFPGDVITDIDGYSNTGNWTKRLPNYTWTGVSQRVRDAKAIHMALRWPEHAKEYLTINLMRGPFSVKPLEPGWEWVQVLIVRNHWNDNHGTTGKNAKQEQKDAKIPFPFQVIGGNMDLIVESVNTKTAFEAGHWAYKDPMNMSAPATQQLLPGDHIIEVNGASGHPAGLLKGELWPHGIDTLLLRVQRRICNTPCGASTFDGVSFNKGIKEFGPNQCGSCHWKQLGKESCAGHEKLIRGTKKKACCQVLTRPCGSQSPEDTLTKAAADWKLEDETHQKYEVRMPLNLPSQKLMMFAQKGLIYHWAKQLKS
eukprot:gnl/MRDRNA2_/MRDRNA2_14926_c0_seq1.p1 gnl/MRDRNA2_/MRDRNA2_14926_c0~~gnl/MRDRNA2_/MRDRNA2_14926_c0_seq1.p1  ORF type:complete len:712 (-),score=125.18 gnl/MRDRNA2_/MRDRNA2_14926_c0_seq1:38-1969(-)